MSTKIRRGWANEDVQRAKRRSRGTLWLWLLLLVFVASGLTLFGSKTGECAGFQLFFHLKIPQTEPAAWYNGRQNL